MTRRALPLAVLLLLSTLPVLPAAAEGGSDPAGDVIDLTFPVADPHEDVRFKNDFLDARSGGRDHGATDIMAPKHRPIHAAVGGTVGYTPYPEPSYGWMLSINGDDGRLYRYIHVNNDNPGTDDGNGGPDHAFAPRIAEAMKAKGDTLNTGDGIRIERGELVGWVGDSGNAESTAPHLHFEIFESHSQSSTRLNPYASLQAALDRGDVPGATMLTAPSHDGIYKDVDPESVHGPSIEKLAADGVVTPCEPDHYCPVDDILRGDLAAFLAAALKLEASAPPDFTDVDETHPNAAAIAAVDEAGILGGYGDGRFGPTDALSRAQLATVLVHAFRVPAGITTVAATTFVDVTDTNVHGTNIAAIFEAGITTGCGTADGGLRYCGTDAVSRSQIASFIDRGLSGS